MSHDGPSSPVDENFTDGRSVSDTQPPDKFPLSEQPRDGHRWHMFFEFLPVNTCAVKPVGSHNEPDKTLDGQSAGNTMNR